jgi:hypothetical protein
MREARISGRVATLALGIAIMTAASPVRADISTYVSRYFPNQPAGAGDNQSEDIDFTTASIATGSSGALSGNKFMVLNLATYNSHAQCFDIFTSGDGTGDTRIWVYDTTINDYRSLNDDGNGLYSHARIWISPPSNGGRYVSPVISAYSSTYNAMKFNLLIVKMKSSTTETQCTSGSTYKSTSSGNTFVNAT